MLACVFNHMATVIIKGHYLCRFLCFYHSVRSIAASEVDVEQMDALSRDEGMFIGAINVVVTALLIIIKTTCKVEMTTITLTTTKTIS